MQPDEKSVREEQGAAGPTVSVLIVGYRSRGDIDACLSSLLRHGDAARDEVLFVDQSDDGSAEHVRSAYPSVRVIESAGNLGFAGGNNYLATQARGRYLLLLNPDTELNDDAIGALLRCVADRPGAGAWGGVTVLPDGKRDPTSNQARPGLIGELLLLVGLGSLRRGGVRMGASEPAEVSVLSGAFMLVERETWVAIDGFDTSYFLYSEEVDLCQRAARHTGRACVMTPSARIVHRVGGSAATSGRRAAAIARGKMHWAWTWRGGGYAARLGMLIVAHAWTRWLAYSLLGKRERAARYRAVWRSAATWWSGYPRDGVAQDPRPGGATGLGDAAPGGREVVA
ncbi:MAG: glycosyltransferase family 2 protein [Planctomycetota bacterium]